MRILMLNYEFPPLGGGAGNAMYNMLLEFSKYDKLKIDVITSSKSRYYEKQFSKNIKIYFLDVKKKNYHFQTSKETFLWLIKAMRLTRKLGGYDLCHCWTGWPAGIIGYLNRKKYPYLVALRGTDVPGFNERFKTLDKIFFSKVSPIIWKNARKITVNSQGLKELALKTCKAKIDIIPNGVNTEQFLPKEKEKKLTLLTVSRLIPRKGIEYLIRAMKEIDGILLIAGDGPLLSSLKSLAEKYAKGKVKFLGRVKHEALPEIYNKATIFVLPSLYEGMSNSILEAMSCGLPIITTDTGGSKELIAGNGIIIKKRSSAEIVSAVKKTISSQKKYGLRSREIAEKFSWKNVAESYYKLYEESIC